LGFRLSKLIIAIFFLKLFVTTPAFAQVVRSNLSVKFNNQNWYPLTLQEMEKASVDTALAEIAKAGVFKLNVKNKVIQKTKSIVSIEISLVEAASSVKVTVRISSPKKPEVVATASGSIKDKKFQGIFKEFENVGRSAGKKARKLISIHYAAHSKTAVPSGIITSSKKLVTSNLHPWVMSFKNAQKLKENYEFSKSKTELKKLYAKVKKNKDWEIAVHQELFFDLPNFEAQYLLTIASGNVQAPDYKAQIYKIKELYKYIIENNPSHPIRVQQAKSSIDSLSTQKRYVGLAQTAQAKTYFAQASIQYIQYVSMYGEDPGGSKYMKRKLKGKSFIQYILEDVYPESKVTVIQFNKNSGEVTYRVKSKYGAGNHKVSGNLVKRHRIHEIKIEME
jgi:hypothetical protein